MINIVNSTISRQIWTPCLICLNCPHLLIFTCSLWLRSYSCITHVQIIHFTNITGWGTLTRNMMFSHLVYCCFYYYFFHLSLSTFWKMKEGMGMPVLLDKSTICRFISTSNVFAVLIWCHLRLFFVLIVVHFVIFIKKLVWFVMKKTTWNPGILPETGE